MNTGLGYVLRGATLCALCIALTGCMSFNPRSLRQMDSALRDSNPDMEFESTTKFGVGPMTMNLVDFIFVHDRHIDLSKISRADVGIYELKQPIDFASFRMPQGNDRNCPQRQVIVRVMEDDERMEMAVCIRNDRITGFAMFMIERDEIVVMNIRGDIEALVSSAVRNSVNGDSPRNAERASTSPPQDSPVAFAAGSENAPPAS